MIWLPLKWFQTRLVFDILPFATAQSRAQIKLLPVSEAAILKFYFRFRFWRVYCHRHVSLHLLAKFRSNRTISGSYYLISIFQHGGHEVGNQPPNW